MQFIGINLDSAFGPNLNAMSAINMMQKASADNIANVDTPGYRAKHYDFATALGAQSSVMDTSLSARMGTSKLNEMVYQQGDAGKVNVQDEFMTMQKNLLYFNMLSKRLSTVVTNIKTGSQVGR
jgi:flagellar basal-body rod protein FlgB